MDNVSKNRDNLKLSTAKKLVQKMGQHPTFPSVAKT